MPALYRWFGTVGIVWRGVGRTIVVELTVTAVNARYGLLRWPDDNRHWSRRLREPVIIAWRAHTVTGNILAGIVTISYTRQTLWFTRRHWLMPYDMFIYARWR